MTFALACSRDTFPESSFGLSAQAPVPIRAPLDPLVTRMADGDQAALGELYDATSSLIYGLALRMLGHAQDAEEVVSDVYMKAWRQAANYSRERGSVAAWLVMMTRSIAIDRIRQRRPQQRGAPTLEEIAEPASRGPSPEQEVLSTQTRFRIEQALGELPAEQRSLLEMAFFSGLTHAELAEQTGIPLGTVKTRIRLGLQRLRGALGIHMGGGME